MNGKLTIGIHMHAGWESTRRATEGVIKYAGEHDLAVRDFNFAEDDPYVPEYPPWLGKADGVVIALSRNPGVLTFLKHGRVPVVNTGGDLSRDIVSVFTDPRALADLAVAHFLDAGIRSFAYVGCRSVDSSHERCRALMDALAQKKLPLKYHHTEQLFSGTYEDFATLDDLEPKLVRMLKTAKKPVGVAAINDRWATVVCRIAQELGFSIPQDVAVLGVGDTDVARLATPPISSIRTAGEKIGYEATRLVHRLIRGERLARKLVMLRALEMVPRESTMGKRRAITTDVDRALEYIRDKACEGIRVEDVATHVNIPKRTFELQFSNRVGRSVGEEIRRVLMDRAKTLLETTDLPLTTVAHQVGMTDTPCLNGFFRRWLNTTPAKYRQRHRRD